ncbi:MAG: substrate-binding domain-containing protein [Victivallaceae bacterium]|nr:substrate-binding domain-containing protein [Victivallaceae bacterium]
MKTKIFLSLFLAAVFCIVSLVSSGCSKGKSSRKVFVFVPKCENILYMKLFQEGFEQGCREIGVEPLYRGSDVCTVESQIAIVRQLAAQNVAGMVVDANDPDALRPALNSVSKRGIKVISADSAVHKDARIVHVQAAECETVGRTLIRAAHEMVNGEGGIAILSATPQTTIQNEWIYWMRRELEENPVKYRGTPLIKVAYGDDEPIKSTSEALALLKDQRIKIIISPTTIGMLAAGKVLQDKQSQVKLTGLGLPSEMAPFIKSGVCPWMYLWNPIAQGRLSAHVLAAVVDGRISGTAGEKFSAGPFGERTIVPATDGGTEVVLDEPFRFDSSNIDEWQTKL